MVCIWVRVSGRIWARTGTYIWTDRYVFQCIYLLTMARIWHVQVRIWHVQWHVSGTVLGTYIAVRFRSDSTAGSCSVRCSSTTGLLSLIESSTNVCTQVPNCHSLLQQPAASAPRPATRPASATKQQPPPAALATVPLPASTPPVASAARRLPPVPPGGCRCRTRRRGSATAPLPASTAPAASAARRLPPVPPGGCRCRIRVRRPAAGGCRGSAGC